MKKVFCIPVVWEEVGMVRIEADTIEEAIEIAETDETIELPDGNYVDGSFSLASDDPDYIKVFN